MKIRGKLALLLNGRVGRAVATVASGAVIGQVITILLMPIVTRLFDPGVMGIQSIFVSVGNALATAAALTYPLALTLPEKETDAKYLMILSVLVALVSSIAVLGLIIVAHDYVLGIFNYKGIGGAVYLLPLYVFFSVLGVVAAQYLIREKKFKAIARTSWELSAIVNCAKVLGGVLYPLLSTLIVVNVLSGLARFLLSIRFIISGLGKGLQGVGFRGHLNELALVANKYKDFPFYRAPQALIAAISQSMPLVIIAALYDANIVGQFALAVTVLSLPANFIGAAVSQVMYPIVNDSVRAGREIAGDIARITILMGLIGVPIFGVIAVEGDRIFGLVFGENWVLAGEFSQWLTLMMFLEFLSRPVVSAIPVLGLQKGLLFFEIVFFIVKSTALFISFYAGFSSINFVLLYSVSCAAMSALLIFWAARSSYLYKTMSVRNG